MPGAEIAVSEESAHLPHLEERTAYLAVVRGFMQRVDEVVASNNAE